MTERAIGSGKWKKLRLQVLDRDGRQCIVCNGPADTVDHIVPRVQGGDMWAMDNLQAMCKSHNSAKGGRFFSVRSTPLVFPERSLPETVRTIPESPFMKPETIQVDAG